MSRCNEAYRYSNFEWFHQLFCNTANCWRFERLSISPLCRQLGFRLSGGEGGGEYCKKRKILKTKKYEWIPILLMCWFTVEAIHVPVVSSLKNMRIPVCAGIPVNSLRIFYLCGPKYDTRLQVYTEFERSTFLSFFHSGPFRKVAVLNSSNTSLQLGSEQEESRIRQLCTPKDSLILISS